MSGVRLMRVGSCPALRGEPVFCLVFQSVALEDHRVCGGLLGDQQGLHWVGDIGFVAAQFLDHREAAERDLDLGIAAFMGEDQATLAEVLGELFQAGGHVAEGALMGEHSGQRVHAIGVKAAGDDDQVGVALVEWGEVDESRVMPRPTG